MRLKVYCMLKKRSLVLGPIGLTFSLLLVGCTSNETPVVGSLTAISSSSEIPSGVTMVTTSTRIGEVTVDHSYAVFDAPNGVTIGRIDPGTYPVLETVGDFLQIELPISSEYGYPTAYIPLIDTKVTYN